MKNLYGMTGAVLVASAMILSSPQALAAPNERLDWGHQLNATETACPSGDLIIKVVRKVINALDSGTGLNDFGHVWWADSEYIQHIQVVQTGADTFCATVKSQGSFESVGGDGPGCSTDATCGVDPDGRLEAEVVGTFQGGYTNTFTGTFSPGGMRTKGSIGTFDGFCDASTAAGCPGGSVFSAWRDDYFTGYVGSLPWWGWVYHAGNNGSWVNKIDGNEGNILGE